MDADVFISLTHFKGHETAGFGGAIKNIGMGCGSRAGKMEQHCDGKPSVDQDNCIGCGACSRICAHDAPVITERKALIDLLPLTEFPFLSSSLPKPVYHSDTLLLPDNLLSGTLHTRHLL